MSDVELEVSVSPTVSVSVSVVPIVAVSVSVQAAASVVSAASIGPEGPPGEVGELGPEGPPGPAGTAGNGGEHAVEAAQALSAERVVTWAGLYADPVSAAPIVAAGVSRNAAAAGGDVVVVRQGPLESLAWSWAPGALLYCGPGGVLTSTHDPSWVYVLVVARALTPTRILVDLQPPIRQ